MNVATVVFSILNLISCVTPKSFSHIFFLVTHHHEQTNWFDSYLQCSIKKRRNMNTARVYRSNAKIQKIRNNYRYTSLHGQISAAEIECVGKKKPNWNIVPRRCAKDLWKRDSSEFSQIQLTIRNAFSRLLGLIIDCDIIRFLTDNEKRTSKLMLFCRNVFGLHKTFHNFITNFMDWTLSQNGMKESM